MWASTWPGCRQRIDSSSLHLLETAAGAVVPVDGAVFINAAALGGEGEGGKTTDLPGLGSPNGQGNTAGTTTGGTTGGNSTTATGTDDKDKEKLK